jgi:hypothetical protein
MLVNAFQEKMFATSSCGHRFVMARIVARPKGMLDLSDETLSTGFNPYFILNNHLQSES